MSDRRLLILDDDPDFGRMMQEIAATASIPSRHVVSPEEFFAVMKDWKPTNIAIDLQMPDMDGVKVMEELARLGCTAEIIILSGVDERVLDAAARSARNFGLKFVGVLSKPFTPRALLSLLSTSYGEEGPRNEGINTSGAKGAMMSADDLRQAIAQGYLQAFYQPKVDCANHRLLGFEALARVVHPEHGVLYPDSFIPVAEANGLMGDLTRAMVEQVLSFLVRNFSPAGQKTRIRRAAKQDKDRLRVSINLSAQVLRRKTFVEELVSACSLSGIDPEHIILELTETAAMENPAESLAMLTRLRVKGFRLSLDDFGIGYSSMQQLVKLPFSEIKIDKSFVLTSQSSEESRTVIESIVHLASSLGLSSVAEGVEDMETLEYLRSVGCEVAQGYLLSRPVSERDLMAWMQRNCVDGCWMPLLKPSGSPAPGA
jgi:EAL domain-containing protein (putative c-di-GMP-specific phosphodiesterase class I)/ActR/RegA family two-component response regulator